jgi:hypothetical protein
MPSLNRDHRRLLENTVAQARAIAEEGARKVLTDQYAVHNHEPWQHMTPEERELRNQLRAYGRQLGDRRDDRRDTQEIDHLVKACAYEHWHRMLFARFLAENDLLLDADHGMSMSLDEVRELARERNRDWLEIAAELAQKMLLAVFRPDDPVLRVSLTPETRQQLEDRLASLPAEIFQADDSLGWVYQFWQRDEKDRVNKSEVKIGADELPAVTQLFTEDYMVHFILENTLGAWWTSKRRIEGKNPVLPGYEWTYLRLNEDESPAAGSFEGWPRAACELRVLDPSMGSGHFLTFALPILARMRVEEEGLTLQDAIVVVLRDNLHGLELDARCSQIAAFNLALAAWRLAGKHISLPSMNVACSGLGIHAAETDWVDLAGEDGLAREEMRRIYSLFKDAPTLGSLIDPLRLSATVYSAGADRVLPLIEEALHREQNDDVRELAIAAQGVLSAFRILASRFNLVATNVPYLGRGKQNPVLAQYCAEFHSDAKADLATCFVDRCLRFCGGGGSVGLVTPQNWLFLTSYKKLRDRLLKDEQWNFVARLGEHGFESAAAAGAFAAMLSITQVRPSTNHAFPGWDVSENQTPAEKAAALQSSQSERLTSNSFQPNASRSLRRFARCYQGLSTGDNPGRAAYFWEVKPITSWSYLQLPPETSAFITGRTSIVRNVVFEDDFCEGAIRGREAWGKRGIAIARIRSLSAALYDGDFFVNTMPVIIPEDPQHLTAIWCFAESPEFRDAVSSVSPALSVDNGYLEKIPFDLEHWQSIAAERYPHGLPKPHTADPTQWVFSGHPKESEHPLQVAVARLVGYRWPRQTGSSFPDCPALQPDALDNHADLDGIVPLNAIAGEASAADRLRALLKTAYSADWSATQLQNLVGGDSLEQWLRDRFFEEHCSQFDHRPFVWHIWDGRKDGFHVLVSYHRLVGADGEGRQTLEKLIYTYLGDWISRQRADLAANVEGADGRLTAAVHLKGELENILAGAPPYDVFVRWKPLQAQPIGWEPDLNDGVRINIRPWLTATPYQPGRRETCILRITPRMNYGKDRGREPHKPKDDFPWFWSWDEQSDDFLGGKDFDGARWNDLHYSLETKLNARLRAQSIGSSE